MQLLERILEEAAKLPESLQAEVLDFVQYLAFKSAGEANQEDELSFGRLSLTLAMRGMEDEEMPACSTDDLRVVF
ncbi:MAG: DUF2281 domain-containing protein [Pseudomonadota bacterium]